VSFDALVVGYGPAAGNVVCGLTLLERGRRVAASAGAARVVVVDSREAADLASVGFGERDLLILRASDQVVHTPLVSAVASGTADARVASDPTTDEYAGAIWVPAASVAEAVAAVATDPERGDIALAARWLAEGRAQAVPHGDIARHPAVTRQQRRDATRMLFGLVHKTQDGALSKYLFRPVAYPITRALLPTPITPNQVSIFVGLLALTGCWIASGPSYWDAVIGSLLAHIAGYFDCTDGEIARLRHEGSKLGMWLDTIADEATTVGYLAGIGYHVYQRHPSAWIGWSIPIGLFGTFVTLYVIYNYLIVVARSGNSQDYPTPKGGPFEPLAGLLHRDFIGLAALVAAIANVTEISYALLFLGAVVSACVLMGDHIKLRRQRSALGKRAT
jgi:phosphatidylglycerophosphate synthase